MRVCQRKSCVCPIALAAQLLLGAEVKGSVPEAAGQGSGLGLRSGSACWACPLLPRPLPNPVCIFPFAWVVVGFCLSA